METSVHRIINRPLGAVYTSRASLSISLSRASLSISLSRASLSLSLRLSRASLDHPCHEDLP